LTSYTMFFFFQAEDGIRDRNVTGVQTCALPIYSWLWSVLLLLPTLAQAAIVAVGTWGVVQGWTTVGTVVAAVTISMVLRMPIEMLGFLLADALMALTAAGRYWEVIDLRHAITDADGRVDDDPATRSPMRTAASITSPRSVTTGDSWASRMSRSTSPTPTVWPGTTSTCGSSPARPWRWSVRRDRARRPWPRSSPGCRTSPRAR